MMVEVHKIHPIGLMEDGYTYHVVVREGAAFWAFDLPELQESYEGPPTLIDVDVQYEDEWLLEIPSEFVARPSNIVAA